MTLGVRKSNLKNPSNAIFPPQKPVRPWPYRPYQCRQPCSNVGDTFAVYTLQCVRCLHLGVFVSLELAASVNRSTYRETLGAVLMLI